MKYFLVIFSLILVASFRLSAAVDITAKNFKEQVMKGDHKVFEMKDTEDYSGLSADDFTTKAYEDKSEAEKNASAANLKAFALSAKQKACEKLSFAQVKSLGGNLDNDADKGKFFDNCVKHARSSSTAVTAAAGVSLAALGTIAVLFV